MERKDILREAETIVVKVGTSSITAGGSSASMDFMDSIARQVADLKRAGKKVLLVTSGAIGLGTAAMGVKPKPRDVPTRQAAAAVGQGILMQKWNDSFQKEGIVIAQILLTLDFYSDREKYLNLRNAIYTLLEHDVVPVINENDVICVKEIDAMFGDNDTLSAYISSKMDADLLVILSDVDGLYEKNPKLYPDAKMLSVVEDVSKIDVMAGDALSKSGTGGMKTKLAAALICREAGCTMVIANSNVADVLSKVTAGEDIGTVFMSGTRERKRSRWIKRAHASGSITLDEGAAEKLLSGKVSLLAVGIKSVDGKFDRGDVVSIVFDGKVIAKGTPDYDSDDIRRIKGLKSTMIDEVLGHKSYDDVIRSENIVLM